MKIMMEFSGMSKQFNDWNDEKEIDLPEGSTTSDALNLFGIDETGGKKIEFLVVNDVMIKTEEVLKDGDRVKVFPRAFGG